MKFLMILALTVLSAPAMMAQMDFDAAVKVDSLDREIARAKAELQELVNAEVQSEVWHRGRYLNVGYTYNNTVNEVYSPRKSHYSFFLTKGTSYLFPQKAFSDMAKVGVDVRWFDFQFAYFGSMRRNLQYENGIAGAFWTNGSPIQSGTGLNVMPEYAKFAFRSVMIGALGVGPTVTLAPLTWLTDSPARTLRVNFYMHYMPNFGVCSFREKYYRAEGEMLGTGTDHISVAYVGMIDFGAKLMWRWIGFGVEGRSGSGRFHDSFCAPAFNGSNCVPFYINGTTKGGSYKRKFGETRIYLTFTI